MFHVNGDEGIDYIGAVFGYQNNKKFYVALWRHKNMNYLNTTYKAGIKGIQIKVCEQTNLTDFRTDLIFKESVSLVA